MMIPTPFARAELLEQLDIAEGDLVIFDEFQHDAVMVEKVKLRIADLHQQIAKMDAVLGPHHRTIYRAVPNSVYSFPKSKYPTNQ